MRKRKQISNSASSEGSSSITSYVMVIKRSLERLNSSNIALHAGVFVVKLPDDCHTAFRTPIF